MYRLSQDHPELFFGSVRATGGHNNNPTARQFRSAYKKLVIRQNNIEHFNTGNCIPLDHIDILHYSSSDPIEVINNSSNNNYDNIVDSDENSIIHNNFVSDHDYITCQYNYIHSDFSKELLINYLSSQRFLVILLTTPEYLNRLNITVMKVYLKLSNLQLPVPDKSKKNVCAQTLIVICRNSVYSWPRPLRAIYPVKCEQRFGVHYTDVSEQPTSTGLVIITTVVCV
ncbi:hypothetical protein AGLY_001284 [Aphis glycines]|uniref:Transposable element P transposase-like RNase H C-terminal domain-containing protein n=1 Tax=Aphis glycines TaxID=307491 RepID=A0A6G0U9D2_APHGL|nr:hypothetical protein AGLY_001284 [Aphis glycines]